MPGGSYAITAVATDNSGNTTTSSAVNVNVGTVGKITYLHNDFSGSPIAATDSAGSILWKENYHPFGDQRNVQAAGMSNRQWFHGKPEDEDTGLSYFGARYYDATLGRFMGVDPVGFQAGNYHSFNRYAYGNNNPYRYLDPDGRSPLDVGFLVFDTVKLGLALYSGVGVGGCANFRYQGSHAAYAAMAATAAGTHPRTGVLCLRYLHDDYIVDNRKLKSTGYTLKFPDFRASMAQLSALR